MRLQQLAKGWVKDWLSARGVECRINPYAEPWRLQRQLTTSDTPVIFDVGAHVGQSYTVYRRLFPKAEIHLFEPFVGALETLKPLTQDDSDCTLHEVALSDHDGERDFHVNTQSATNSLNAFSATAAQHWQSAQLESLEKNTVSTRTADSLCTEFGIERIDIMKIDVQGAEYEVLQGAANLLESGAIRLLQLEFILANTYADQHPLHEYLALLHHYGYQLLDLYQPLRNEGRLLQCDLMFAAPETFEA